MGLCCLITTGLTTAGLAMTGPAETGLDTAAAVAGGLELAGFDASFLVVVKLTVPRTSVLDFTGAAAAGAFGLGLETWFSTGRVRGPVTDTKPILGVV